MHILDIEGTTPILQTRSTRLYVTYNCYNSDELLKMFTLASPIMGPSLFNWKYFV